MKIKETSYQCLKNKSIYTPASISTLSDQRNGKEHYSNGAQCSLKLNMWEDVVMRLMMLIGERALCGLFNDVSDGVFGWVLSPPQDDDQDDVLRRWSKRTL